MKNNLFNLRRLGTSMTRRFALRAAIALFVASASATWCLLAMTHTGPIMNPSKEVRVTHAPTVTPYMDIASAGPLTHVYLGNELSCQVWHALDGTTGEFYPPFTIPGDSGTFIAMDGMLYAPDFTSHGTTATGGLGAYTPFTPVSQTAVTGSGTAADPYQVVTVVDVGATGLHIQQTDKYVVGDEAYRTEIMITNSGGSPASGTLYRAGDSFLGGSDFGFGFTEVFGTRNAVGCSANPNNVPPGRIEEWIPITGGNNFYQTFYNSLWTFIGTKAPFPDTCGCLTFQDNGAGISWNFSIPAGGSATYSHVTTFSPLGLEALVTSKTADSPTSVAGSQNGYTITIENPNPDPVTLNSITDTLPAGFSYVLGSTSGVTTSDPSVNMQMLTWSGPFVVAANSSVSLHFSVIVASIPGDYFNEAGGQADGGYTVTGTGPTAQITVTQPTACPLTQGFWKNHPNIWPVTSLTLGCQNYTQVELLAILNTAIGKGSGADASLILADQLIAAKLNIANGSDPTPISATITAADAVLCTFVGKLPYHVRPSSIVGQQMTALAATLNQYNNGLLTPNCIP